MLFLLVGLLVLGGLAWAWYMYQKPHQGVEGVKADFKIDAGTLFVRFQQDENKADSQFLDKVVEVKGRVASIEKTDSTLNVELQAGAGPGGINCNVASAKGDRAGLPKKGEVIMVKGRCSGFLMDVNLVDCVIEKSN